MLDTLSTGVGYLEYRVWVTWSAGCWIPGVQGVGYMKYRVWDT